MCTHLVRLNRLKLQGNERGKREREKREGKERGKREREKREEKSDKKMEKYLSSSLL